MKTSVLAVFLTISALNIVAGNASSTSLAAQAPVTPLIRALITVESRGNDHAIGDRHLTDKAYGCLQIRKPCLDDVNNTFGTKIRLDEVYGNRALSVWVCERYLQRYATRKALGREPTDEDRARIWNGGPTGWKHNSTLVYWSKVQKALRGSVLAKKT